MAATLAVTLSAALHARSREAFTALLMDDVRWGGEHGGNECTTREQAGDHYEGLLADRVTMDVVEVSPVYPNDGPEQFDARLRIHSPDPDDFPAQLTVRLTLRDGLIADIRELDPPETIELLYFDGCPHHETFLPHLTSLLAEHGILTSVTLVRIDDDEDAQSHHFLGSPTLRINGRDVDPAVQHREAAQNPANSYAMQCRLYNTPDGNTGSPPDEWILAALINNSLHDAAIGAVHDGDVAALQQLLADNPNLASTRLRRQQGRTLLHIATDWPGHFPNVADTIAALVAAGANPNAGCLGQSPETPLHRAASSNDLAAIDALLDNGADINAPGAVIGNGTPMADATAFGQWEAARRLLDRGAETNLFEAAALGLVVEVQRHLDANNPTAQSITSSFWGACHGGQAATAAVLLDHGADINWTGYDELTPLDAARRSAANDVVEWLAHRGGTTAHPSG